MPLHARAVRQLSKRRAHVQSASILALLFGVWIADGAFAVRASARQSSAPPSAPSDAPRAVFDRYCIACHNQKLRTAGLALDMLDVNRPAANAAVWERVIEKLRAGSMPPPGRPRPDPATYRTVAGWLEREIDRAWIAHPNPGRVPAVHRLNRTEYNNAVHDLLGLDRRTVDVRSLLPGDDTPDGSFDHLPDRLS